MRGRRGPRRGAPDPRPGYGLEGLRLPPRGAGAGRRLRRRGAADPPPLGPHPGPPVLRPGLDRWWGARRIRTPVSRRHPLRGLRGRDVPAVLPGPPRRTRRRRSLPRRGLRHLRRRRLRDPVGVGSPHRADARFPHRGGRRERGLRPRPRVGVRPGRRGHGPASRDRPLRRRRPAHPRRPVHARGAGGQGPVRALHRGVRGRGGPPFRGAWPRPLPPRPGALRRARRRAGRARLRPGRARRRLRGRRRPRGPGPRGVGPIRRGPVGAGRRGATSR